MANLFLTSHQPYLGSLQREFSRLMDAFAPIELEPATTWYTGEWLPHADVTVKDGVTTLQLDLPGLTKNDLEIHVDGHVLHVEGERQAPEADESYTLCRRERAHGHFRRTFTLPKFADTDAVEAQFNNGVLSIRVPGRAELKSRTIKIS